MGNQRSDDSILLIAVLINWWKTWKIIKEVKLGNDIHRKRKTYIFSGYSI